MSQIFISYRREGGEIMAQLLYDKLIARGYTVFYDMESLKGGRFDSKLLDEIEAAEDFVLILPPHGLDRCITEGDWVHQEIKRAIDCHKNIVPVMLRGFTFPNDLPADIAEVSKYNGVNFGTMEFFDAKVRKIIERLKSVSPLGDLATEKEMAVVSGYESFRQRLMAECEELLEISQRYWSKLIADSDSWAHLTHPVNREKIRLLLDDIEKWKEKKKEFEEKANSSIDIYATAYMQEVFHRLEDELKSLTPYEEYLRTYTTLFGIEEEIYAFSVKCREDYESLVKLKERLLALDEEVRSELRQQAEETLERLWKDYENQMTFEKGAALLEQMFLNLTVGKEREKNVFTLEHFDAVCADMEMAQNILPRFNTLYAQCTPEEGSEHPPLFVEKYKEYIDGIPDLEEFVRCGKLFKVAGELCRDIAELNSKDAISVDAVRELSARRVALKEECVYLDVPLVSVLAELSVAVDQTERIAQEATLLHAQRHEGEEPLVYIPYSFEEYDKALLRAEALEKWIADCRSLEDERVKLKEKRLFTRETIELMRLLREESKAAAADIARLGSAEMKIAYAFETKLRAHGEDTVFEPALAVELSEELGGVSDQVKAALPEELVSSLSREAELVARKETLFDSLRTIKENEVQTVFENYKVIEKRVEKIGRLKQSADSFETAVKELPSHYSEIRLPMQELRTELDALEEFVKSTEPFFEAYQLYEWRLAHFDIEKAVLEETAESKEIFSKFRAQKSIVAHYDPKMETGKYFKSLGSLLHRTIRKRRFKLVCRRTLPILSFLLLAACVGADYLFKEEILRRNLYLPWLLCTLFATVVHPICLRYLRVFRTGLFAIPVAFCAGYAFFYVIYSYVKQVGVRFWYAIPTCGVFVLIVLLSLFSSKKTWVARLFSGFLLAVLIITPLATALTPVMEETMDQGGEALEFLDYLSDHELMEGAMEGIEWMLLLPIGGGFWAEDYVGTALTNLSMLFLFSLVTRIICRKIIKKRRKKEHKR